MDHVYKRNERKKYAYFVPQAGRIGFVFILFRDESHGGGGESQLVVGAV